jgi:MinD-like ATPase involved in chromosome partitioning or flagellar assembly
MSVAEKEKIITVWGSPHSGKTTFALKLAEALYEKTKATVIVLFCDMTTPTLPILFPNHKANELYSIGNVLSKTDIFANDVVSNLITLKERMNLGFLGYRNKENRFSFPEYTSDKVEELFRALREVADYIVVDCETNPQNSVLTDYAMKRANILCKLATPDLSSLGFYQSQNGVMMAGGYYPTEQLLVMNIPSDDLTMLSTDTGAHLGKVDLVVPYSQTLREQYLEGKLVLPTHDKRYMQAIRAAVEAVR